MADQLVPLPPTRPEKTSFTGISNVYPVTADYFNAQIAEAEERGRRKGWAEAIATLRDGQRIADQAWRANTAAADYTLRDAADYLINQAPKETT